MRIMTANIWGDYFKNPVYIREGGILTVMNKYSPDVLGMQEITRSWYESRMFASLKEEYTLVCGFVGNFVPLMFRTAKFSLIECGYEHYAKTPDESKGITYAVLEEKKTGRTAAFLNTHFWWKTGEEHDAIRVENARQLLAKMKYLREKYGCEVYSFGDLNCILGSGALGYLAENGVLTSVELCSDFSACSSHHGDPVRGEDGLYHGKKTQNPKELSIDHIVSFADTSKIVRQRVVEDDSVLDSTDHSPVYVDIE